MALIQGNPAAELKIPRKCQAGRAMRPLTEEEVNKYLEVFDLRGEAIARLAIFGGMRGRENPWRSGGSRSPERRFEWRSAFTNGC